MLRLALIVSSLVLAAAAVGCSTNTNSVSSKLTKRAFLKKEKAESFPIYVVIRYPSKISATAAPALREALLNAKFGSGGFQSADESDNQTNSSAEGDITDIKRPAQQLVMRSAYFALVLYKQLRDRLPAGKVVLLPAEIDLDRHGHLHMKDSRVLAPAILRVDAFAYVGSERMVPDTPETFGEFVTPVVSVYSSLAGSPATRGALIGLRPVPLSIGGGAPGSANGHRGTLLSFLNAWRVSKNKASPFADNPANRPAAGLKVVSDRPAGAGRYFAMPLIEYKQDSDKLGTTNPDAADEVYLAYSNLIVEALNSINAPRAVRHDLAQYAKFYDGALARKLEGSGRLSKQELHRLEYLIEALKAEQGVEREISEATYTRLYAGKFGKSVRAIMKREADFRSEYRAKTTRKVIGIILGVASAGAAGYANASGNSAAGTSLMNSANSLVATAASTEQSMNELASAFDSTIAASSTEIYVAKVRFRGKVIEMRGKRLEDIRKKFRAHYWRRFGRRN